jgi:hypothetical protein
VRCLWYVIFLFGVIVGGIIFNAKMRRGFMKFLDSLMSKEKTNVVERRGGRERIAYIDGKRCKIVEEEEDD